MNIMTMKRHKLLILLLEVVFCFFGCIPLKAHNDLIVNFYLREIEERSDSDMDIIPLCDSIVAYAGLNKDTTTICQYLLKKGNCFSANDKIQKALKPGLRETAGKCPPNKSKSLSGCQVATGWTLREGTMSG